MRDSYAAQILTGGWPPRAYAALQFDRCVSTICRHTNRFSLNSWTLKQNLATAAVFWDKIRLDESALKEQRRRSVFSQPPVKERQIRRIEGNPPMDEKQNSRQLLIKRNVIPPTPSRGLFLYDGDSKVNSCHRTVPTKRTEN